MKRTRRVRPRVDLKVDVYKIIDRCVDEGVEAGWRRAHKHTDNPSEATVKEEISRAIMLQMDEVFLWPEPGEG